ncbi:MAG TPA: hypothetical protein PLD20_00845 [Blastocatellia bacterium]|nr:hypothetical protein [Blastocatellia bacterium]HMV81794.1 hypothetical protein [Blastocatellia bacterium]HMY70693.1 hypothetical protein [Blastocatellia bacterium]HMZ16482.1 hypothetical protein [Blastocatellia bacterium]HNG29469.1 hypothetical protein [Blastocatellia bacterium]
MKATLQDTPGALWLVLIWGEEHPRFNVPMAVYLAAGSQCAAAELALKCKSAVQILPCRFARG